MTDINGLPSYEDCPDLGEELRKLRGDISRDKAAIRSGHTEIPKLTDEDKNDKFNQEDDEDLDLIQVGLPRNTIARIENGTDNIKYDLSKLNLERFKDYLRGLGVTDTTEKNLDYYLELYWCNVKRQLERSIRLKLEEIRKRAAVERDERKRLSGDTDLGKKNEE